MALSLLSAPVGHSLLLAALMLLGAPSCAGGKRSGALPLSKPSVPRDIVAQSAHTFAALRTADSVRLGREQTLSSIASAQVVCFGESHTDAQHHFAQLTALQVMLADARAKAQPLALGLEMFQQQFQASLQQYAEGTLDEPGLITATEYPKRWGFDFSYYRPLLEAARGQARLLALNVAQETTRAIARTGLESLSTAQRAALPELDLTDALHRKAFDSAMQEHPMPAGFDFDRMYTAQVLWDEGMAENAANFLKANPTGRLLIIAGLGHCHEAAIPARIRRRVPHDVLSVGPVLEREAAQETARNYDLLWLILP